MKKYLLHLFIVILALAKIDANAQKLDSISFVSQQWENKKLRKGIVWRKAHFESIFNSKQVMNIVEIELTKKNLKDLGIEGLSHSRRNTSVLADSLKALVAINGGFFDMKKGGAVDYIKVNDKVINYSKSPSARANTYLAFNKKNLIITSDSSTAEHYSNVLLSGPYLLENRNVIVQGKSPFNDNRHPRTAVALKNNTLILFTVDGRNSNAEGLNLTELATVLRWYGATQAMNLDGGGSTAMYISKQPNNGIVNYPSDNKIFDHIGERAISNIIFIK